MLEKGSFVGLDAGALKNVSCEQGTVHIAALRLQRPYKSHVIVVPQLMTFSWKNQMGKDEDFLFTVPVGIPCW